MMDKSSKIKLFLLIAAIIITAIILERTYLTSKSPSSMKVMIYKIELMTGASDTNPQTVFSDPAGREIDLANDIIIGQTEVAPGTYKRMRLAVASGVRVSIGKAADDPCGGGSIFTDRVLTLAGFGTDPNLRVQVGFATYDDGGGKWADKKVTHLLLEPAAIGENRNRRIEFKFNTANSLFCIEDKVEMRSPWAGWLIRGTAN
jgi:hypothetical protein